MSSPKYNRTPHLPWSPGRGADDKVSKSVETLLRRPIVITEKMDGSNTSLEKDGCFARTHVGPPTHGSFDGLKALHSQINYMIASDDQYFGEWCYAKHSIEYTSLPGYFMLFAIRHITEQYGNLWAPWEYVSEVAKELEIPTVPVIWRGEVSSAKDLEKLTLKLASMPSMCGGEREGLVVRYEEQFNDERFPEFVMKFVRKNHVQTTEHWKDQEIVKNGLRK